jgi:hypothetical protein
MKGDTVMGCNHEKLRCTNNRFFCLICGQEIQMPKAEPKAEEKEPEKEVKKTARKRKE